MPLTNWQKKIEQQIKRETHTDKQKKRKSESERERERERERVIEKYRESMCGRWLARDWVTER